MEEEKWSEGTTRKQALERLGVYHPKSNAEEEIKQLKSQVSKLEQALDLEKAQRFHDSEKAVERHRHEEIATAKELAQNARQLNQMRVQHQTDLNECKERVLSDIHDQFQKKKGTFYQQTRQDFLAEFQTQINSGKGEFFERALIGTKSLVEKECIGGIGVTYSRIQEKIRADIVEDFKLRRGDLYESVSKDITGQVYQEMEACRVREVASVITAEREFHLKYNQSVDELQEKLQQSHTKLRDDLAQYIIEQNETFHESYTRDIEKTGVEWLHKWTTREHEWLASLSKLEKDRTTDFKTLTDEIESRATNAVAAVTLASHDRNGSLLDSLNKCLGEFKAQDQMRSAGINRQVAATIESVNSLLETHKNNVRAVALQEQHRYEEQLRVMQSLLKVEKESYHESLEKLHLIHQQERIIMDQVVENEQKRCHLEKQYFENEIRDQYEVLGVSLKAQHKLETEELRQERSKLASEKMSMGKATEKLQLQIRKEAETLVQKHWEGVLKIQIQDCKKIETEKRDLLLQQTETRYSVIIRQLEDRYQALVETREISDRTWIEKQIEANEMAKNREDRFKEFCRKLFETRLDEYIKEYNAKLQEMQNTILKIEAHKSEYSLQLEMRVEEIKAQYEKKNAAYMESSRKHFNELILDMKRSHTEELKLLTLKICHVEEENIALEHLHVNQVHQTCVERIQETHEFRHLKRQLHDDEIHKKAGNKVFEQHRSSIIALWENTKTSETEMLSFLKRLFQLVAYTPENQKHFELYLCMLIEKMPLLESAVKRENLKDQIRNIHRSYDSVQVHSVSAERDALMTQLNFQTKIMQTGLDAFRKKYPYEMISINNIPLEKIIANDTQMIPEVALFK